jgi:hypothetical protein
VKPLLDSLTALGQARAVEGGRYAARGGGSGLGCETTEQQTKENHVNEKAFNTILLIALVAAAVFFLALGYQTDAKNVFGQTCRVVALGNSCVRPEWLGLGAAFGVAAFLLRRARFKGN